MNMGVIKITGGGYPLMLVTGNKNKVAEIVRLVGMPIVVVSNDMKLDEIQSTNIEAIAYHKAKKAYDYVHSCTSHRGPVLIEDVSLELPSWDGLPGPFIKFFLKKEDPCEHLLRMADRDPERRATAVCCVTYITDRMCDHFVGRCDGRIAAVPRGTSSFGFDPVFIPDGQAKTFAEMTAEEKNAISHRGIAVRKLKAYLESIGR